MIGYFVGRFVGLMAASKACGRVSLHLFWKANRLLPLVSSTMAELPYASEVMAFTDEELDHYLISVNNVILIHDPENLTPAFLQRLR